MSDDARDARGSALAALEGLVSRVAAAVPQGGSEETRNEYIEETSNVAAQALQLNHDTKAAVERAELKAQSSLDAAVVAKSQSEKTASNIKLAFSLAAVFVVVVLGGLGWLLSKHYDQIRDLEAAEHKAAPLLERAVADMAAATHDAQVEREKREALEQRVRDLEEALRVTRREVELQRQPVIPSTAFERAAGNSERR